MCDPRDAPRKAVLRKGALLNGKFLWSLTSQCPGEHVQSRVSRAKNFLGCSRRRSVDRGVSAAANSLVVDWDIAEGKGLSVLNLSGFR